MHIYIYMYIYMYRYMYIYMYIYMYTYIYIYYVYRNVLICWRGRAGALACGSYIGICTLAGCALRAWDALQVVKSSLRMHLHTEWFAHAQSECRRAWVLADFDFIEHLAAEYKMYEVDDLCIHM